MPACVGEIDIIIISSSSVFQLGDSYQLLPCSYIEAFGGAQSFHVRPNTAVISNHIATTFYQATEDDEF